MRPLPLVVLMCCAAGCLSDYSAGGAAGSEPGASQDGGASSQDGGSSTQDGSGNNDTNAGVDGGGGADAAGPPPGKVPVFIAQGQVGRTTISCDDGHTWTANRAWDSSGDALVCNSTTPIRCGDSAQYSVSGMCKTLQACNDTPDDAKGIVYGAGVFVATWGWGSPGAVRYSTNGIDWMTGHGNDTFGGVAFASGKFVAASRTPVVSSDGQNWSAGAPANFTANGAALYSVRRFASSDYGGGRFLALAAGAGSDMLVSSDAGASWWRPTTLPSSCTSDGANFMSYGGFASGNGKIVLVGRSGNACRSSDGGVTWQVSSIGVNEVLSHVVWTGSEFWVWAQNKRVHSTDGATWTATAMTTPLRIGPVVRGASGTLVATGNPYSGYGDQHFYRSSDGLSWETLPSTAFVAGHPIVHMTEGYVDASACP